MKFKTIEIMGNLDDIWCKGYVISVLSEPSYMKLDDEYCVSVSYHLILDGKPCQKNYAWLYFNTEEEAKSVKAGDLMPKEYWGFKLRLRNY